MAAAPVQEVEVYMIGAEALQARFAGGDRAAAARVVGQHLADEVHRVALSSDRLADHGFGTAIGIHFRRIDERHAEIDAGAQTVRLFGHRGIAFAHVPGSEPEGRHLPTARESDCR